MLEKIGLPPKPSVRGNNWVIDASHCQGCSSQFTFINRKHHCRRCGGLFCGSCTQQRMYLRGQGESPVRICEPCKTLEEAARFEMRYGHKNKSRKGATKLASDNEDDILTKVLGHGVNESVSSDKEPVYSLQRATNASSSNNDMEVDLESTTPEELRQRAVEEKKKHKILKAEGKPEEALRAFKRGKELERRAATLEIELRKNRRKAAVSLTEGKTVRDEKKPKEKDDLVGELRELGWSDLDLHDADKKPVNMTLEGELSTLLKEVSQKTTNPEKGSFGTEKSEVVAIKKRALALKREGKLPEAKEELKQAKILEKQIEERELLGDDDDQDSDDEFSSLIRSMGIDKNEVLASGNDRGRDFDFDHVLRVDDVPNIDGDFDLTEDDMVDPEMSAALQSLGWTEDQETDGSNQDSVAESFALDSDRKTTPKSKMEIQRELLGLKKKALGLRREGKTDEADRVLMNGKALEEKLKELENGQKVKPVAVKRVDFSGPVEVEDEETEDVTDADLNDSSYLSVLQNLGWKEEDEGKVVAEPVKPKSKTEIQRELLGLKRKSLALRREGNIDEAEEVLEKAKSLEARLAEMGGGETVVSGGSVAEKAETSSVSGPELGSVQQRVLAHKRKAVGLKREGKLAEAKEELKLAKLLENGIPEPGFDPVIKTNSSDETDRTPGPSSSKTNGSDETDRTPGPSLTKTNGSDETEVSPPPKLSSRERFKLQQESLSHKRKALKLRREGRTEEADAEFELAKNLESQLEAANESTKPAGPAGGDVSMEDLFDPQLLSALREVGIESSVVNKIPAKAVAAKAVVNEAPAVVNKIPAEAVTAPEVVNKIPAEAVAAKAVVNEERMEMEERIKAEKVKAVKLKRAGKQAEALDALRRAKLLEKKLVS